MPLGIVPVGTGNVLAHEIGLAADAGVHRAHAAERAHHPGHVRPRQRRAVPADGGAGFDGRVIAALDHRFKSYVGKAAYAGPMLGALVRPMDMLTVTVDGTRHEASWAVVANARHYGGRFVLAPRTGIRERGLQAILFKAKNRAVLIGQLMSLVMGKLDARAAAGGDVEMLPCTRARSPPSIPCRCRSTAMRSAPPRWKSKSGSASCSLIVPAESPRTATAPALTFVNQISQPWPRVPAGAGADGTQARDKLPHLSA